MPLYLLRRFSIWYSLKVSKPSNTYHRPPYKLVMLGHNEAQTAGHCSMQEDCLLL